MGSCCSRSKDQNVDLQSSSRSISIGLAATSNKNTLENFDHTTIDFLPHRKKIIDAKVIDCYDGDTITILYGYGNEFLKTKIRVIGIDTPEIRVLGEFKGTSIGNLEQEAALHVKNDVKNLIENKIFKVRMDKFDKYGGRVNGTIFLPLETGYNTLSDYLIAKRYAKEYSGNKKENWTSEELMYILEH